MSHKRTFEVGRVCVCLFGRDYGKLATVVDFIDFNKVLVDGPKDITGVARQKVLFSVLSFAQYPTRRMGLTQWVVKIKRGASTKEVEAAFKTAGIQDKWEKSGFAKKVRADKAELEMNDFERFKRDHRAAQNRQKN